MPSRGRVAFIENRGQWNSEALFLAQAKGMSAWITPRGITLDLHRTNGGRQKGHVLQMELVGVRQAEATGVEQLPGVYNYLLGNRPENWTTDVRHFAETRAEGVYPGIDVRWYGDGGQPRYDFIVAPGANPGDIAMRWNGTTSVRVQDGVLRLGTSLGDLRHRDLRAYQVVGGHERDVDCRMVASGTTVRFAVGDYDRSRPLVIDPVIYATHLGGNATDELTDVVLDLAGRPIVGGHAASTNFPTTVGAYDRSIEGPRDAVVTKFNQDCSELIWSTYIGGNSSELTYALATTSTYEVVLTGVTFSTSFPTVNAMDSTLGGSSDAFVTVLAGNGKSLVFSTYLGGGADERTLGVAVDSTDRPIVVGYTMSTDFPGAANTKSGGNDGFVAALKADGSAIDYCRYLGGTELDTCQSITLDSLGRAYITGTTYSTNFPITAGAYDTTYAGFPSPISAFVARVNWDGGYVGTFLHGTANAAGYSIKVDSDGSVVVAGTTSDGFPVTAGVYDETHNGSVDHFVARLSGDLSALTASTLIGGPNQEGQCDIAIMPNRTIALLGAAGIDYPTTASCFNPNDYTSMLAVARLTSDFKALTYSSVVEGWAAGNIRPSGAGTVVIAGSANAPTAATGNAFQLEFQGGADGLVGKFDLVPSVVRCATRTYVGGITSATGSIVLPTAAPAGGTPVALASTFSSIDVPEIVTVPAGSKTVTFPIVSRTTLNPRDRVILTASWGSKTHGIQLDVLPGGLTTFTLRNNVLTGGRSTTGTVTLSEVAPVGGRTVFLSTPDAAITLPAKVIIPEGAATLTFGITTSKVVSRHVSTLTATLRNETRTQTLTLNPVTTAQ